MSYISFLPKTYMRIF